MSEINLFVQVISLFMMSHGTDTFVSSLRKLPGMSYEWYSLSYDIYSLHRLTLPSKCADSNIKLSVGFLYRSSYSLHNITLCYFIGHFSSFLQDSLKWKHGTFSIPYVGEEFSFFFRSVYPPVKLVRTL